MSADLDDDAVRIASLAKRVRWIDRYRRAISILVMLIAAPLIMRELTADLGADWPEAHTILLTLVFAVIGWWVLEVGLAWLAAIWETEYDRLTRHPGLPRAELRPRRGSPKPPKM
ncbi:MAG: hypothetical protein JWO36_3715 [Myxococcales bacterium]|nr:hypothetical protein [Myxococcales bacterium]